MPAGREIDAFRWIPLAESKVTLYGRFVRDP